jgi:subtilisin
LTHGNVQETTVKNLSLIMRLLNRAFTLGPLKGYRTYLAAVGLVGLSVYSVSVGEYDKAAEMFLAALAAFGVRSAIQGIAPKPESPEPASPEPASLAIGARNLVVLVAACAALAVTSARADEGPIYRLPDSELLPEKLTLTAGVTPDWSVAALKLEAAHKITKGKSVRVAILDTGVDTNHQDLVGKVLANRDFTGSRNGAADVQGHGTHCAGIALRVAPEAEFLNGKVLGDSGSGSSLGIASGIDWAVEGGADVISMSLGSSAPDSRIRAAVQRAVARGVIVIAAAGNEGPGEGTVGFPGGFPECVCVASTNSVGQVSRYSSRGPRVDIAAPGESIRSTYPGGRYAVLSGTSMATPQIAGIAALAVSHARTQSRKLTPDEFRELLLKTASDLPPPGRDTASGAGFVRPPELLASLTGDSPSPPPTGERIEFGAGDLTPSGLEKLRRINPRLERIEFVLKP